MRVSIAGFEQTLEFDSGVGTICIHDIAQYRRVAEALLDNYYRRNENNVLVIHDKETGLDVARHSLIVTDVYGFDLSGRTLVAALYRQLQTQSHQINPEKMMRIEQDVLRLLGDIEEQSNCDIAYKSEVEIADIIKMMHVVLASSARTTYVERLYGILDSAYQLLDKRVVVFVGQRELLAYSELCALLQYAENQQISVLFLEKSVNEWVDGEYRLVIDKDLYDFSTGELNNV